jgi:hypothetical protein
MANMRADEVMEILGRLVLLRAIELHDA